MIGGPGSFYAHYSGAKTVFEHILPENRLRLSPYPMLRDPLEAQEWGFHVARFADETPHTTPAEHAEASAAVRREAQRLKKRIKVLCLTEDEDLAFEEVGVFARCYARPRMWQRYAHGHRGACLLLSREPLEEAMADVASGADFAHRASVTYRTTGIHDPRGLSTLIGWDRHCDQSAAVEEYLRAHWRHYLFTKLADWQSEHEYRLAVLGDAARDQFVDCRRAICAIVLGHRFPPSRVPDANAACEQAGVSLWRISWEGGYPTTTQVGGGSRAAFRLTLGTE